MSDSSTNIDQITSVAEEKEAAANENFNALSPFFAFARRRLSGGLNWLFYGIARWYIDGAAVNKGNSSLVLTASTTLYVSADRTLTVSTQTGSFPADKLALYKIVAGASAVTSYEDHRDTRHEVRFKYSRVTIAMGGANKTLSYEQAMADSIVLTGSSGALLDVVVPAIPRDWKIYANTTGGGGIRVKTASGSGPTIADGKRAIVECDGTNVVRVTPDT